MNLIPHYYFLLYCAFTFSLSSLNLSDHTAKSCSEIKDFQYIQAALLSQRILQILVSYKRQYRNIVTPDLNFSKPLWINPGKTRMSPTRSKLLTTHQIDEAHSCVLPGL